MLKNLAILLLSSVLSFSAGLAATQYCPYVKKHLSQSCYQEKKDCCFSPKE